MQTADLSMQNKDFCFQLAETSSSCSFFLRHHATAYSFQSRSTRETESWCLFDLGRLNKRNKLQNSSYHCFIAILAIILDHLPLKFISGFPNVPSKQRVEICGTWAGHQGNLRKCSHGNTTTSKSMEILENTTTVYYIEIHETTTGLPQEWLTRAINWNRCLKAKSARNQPPKLKTKVATFGENICSRQCQPYAKY